MIISKSKNNEYGWGNGCQGWVILNEMDLSIILEEMPPGTSEANHYHKNKKQIFIVQKGTLTIYLEGTKFELGPEQSLKIAKGKEHHVLNKSNEVVQFLVVSNMSDKDDKVLVV